LIPSVAARVQRIREVRERLLSAGGVVGRGDGRWRELFPVAVGGEEGQALRDWVRREGARRTLETGLGFGISALFICEGLLANGSAARHVAVDPYQFSPLPRHATTYPGVGLQILEEAGVRDLVEFYPEESQIALPRLLAEERQFDLVFLDGNHRFEGVFLDLIYSGRLLKPGGIVFADDTQLPAIRRAIGFCLTNLHWTAEDEGQEGDHEWMILRTGPSDVFLRDHTQFVEF
jgi:predicted O-methyltransferase YrrM